MNSPDTETPQKSPENPLEKVLFGGLNQAISKVLELDPAAHKKLHALQGKTVAVRLRPVTITLFIHVDETGLRLLPDYDGKVDTTIEGSPLALFAMGSETPVTGLSPVHVEGDASTGQHLAKWLKQLKPDWEEALCRLLGDGPGVRVASTVRSGMEAGQRITGAFLRNGVEYLTEESRAVLTRHELEPFYDAVDDLRADTDRLQQRIRQLRQRLGSDNT